MSRDTPLVGPGPLKIGLSWLVLVWERLWRALWPAAIVIGAFLATALSDLLTYLPGWLHLALLLAFASGLGTCVYLGVKRFRAPSREDAQRWLERINKVPHRPLQALEDRPATAKEGDPAAALWARHQAMAAAAVRRLKVAGPRPNLARRDPLALRIAVLLLVVVSLAGANREAGDRLLNALSPDFSVTGVGRELKIDAWVTPPAYTGHPPIFLTGEGKAVSAVAAAPLSVPTGSEMTVQVAGLRGTFSVDVAGEPAEIEPLGGDGQRANPVLVESGEVALKDGEKQIAAWAFDIIPDNPPEIRQEGVIGESRQGALQVGYVASDDYGIDRAFVVVRRTDQGQRAAHAMDPIELRLPLSSSNPRESEGMAFFDLTPHPWAGLPVDLTLVAVDLAGQRGESEPIEIVLPERVFTHPVARVIVEQRKRLVWEGADSIGLVARALRGLAWNPAAFDDDVVVFMALTTAARRLRRDMTDTEHGDILELLWETALRIEEGRLALAARALRQAEEALMEALERDADTEELERLLNQLEAAMNEYLQAMMENAQQMQQGEMPEMPGFDPEMRMIDRQDLQSVMDRIREMLRSGMKDAARRMLSQLQQMMENLRVGQQMRMSPEGMEAMEMMDGLQELIQGQRELLDRTFQEMQRRQQQGRGEQQQGQQPMPGQQGMPQFGQQGQGMPQPGQGGEQAGGAMPPDAVLQEALRRQLGDLMRRFGEMMGDIPRPFGRAEGAMRESTDALSQDQPGSAVGPQGEALDQLQQAAQQAAQQLMERLAQGQGQGQQSGRNQQGQEDPFGRMQGAEGGGIDQTDVDIPDADTLQRARSIRDELRRRSGQPDRPQLELDYIERLLKQFQ